MNALSDAGIYVILDVNTPKFAINRDYPKESYNDIYLQHVFATVVSLIYSYKRCIRMLIWVI